MFSIAINITPRKYEFRHWDFFKELLFIHHNISPLLDCSQLELFPLSHTELSNPLSRGWKPSLGLDPANHFKDPQQPRSHPP
jgi:hypothetical protein